MSMESYTRAEAAAEEEEEEEVTESEQQSGMYRSNWISTSRYAHPPHRPRRCRRFPIRMSFHVVIIFRGREATKKRKRSERSVNLMLK